MGNDHWPLFDLEVRSPEVTLRTLDDELARQVLDVAARGIHDPATTPFHVPWTDLPSPKMEQEAMRFYARARAENSPEAWNLQFAVIADGAVIGSCDLGAKHFTTLRQFQTGSWIGREFQGRGLGTAMRVACLTLGFDGFGAEIAQTAAWKDNQASLGVTRSLGYVEEGRRRERRRDDADEIVGFRMLRSHWETIRPDDVELVGVEAALEFLAIEARPASLP